MKKTNFRLRVVLGLLNSNYPQLLERAKAIHNGIAAHPQIFAQPDPSLATLKDRIDAFDLAQQAVATRAQGTVATRNVKADELIFSLESARTYVQERVDASPDQGAVILDASAMRARTGPTYSKPLIKATQATAGGPVRLVVNVGMLTTAMIGKVVFHWQVSDDGGSSWKDRTSTPIGQTELASLTPLVIHAFRVRVTSAKATGEWSHAVTLLVR